jgi:hypothetical protein
VGLEERPALIDAGGQEGPDVGDRDLRATEATHQVGHLRLGLLVVAVARGLVDDDGLEQAALVVEAQGAARQAAPVGERPDRQ